MPETFNCPQCGASVTYDGPEATMACPYCNSQIAVPPGTSVRRRWNAFSPTAKLVIVLFIVVVVAPACLGLAGAVLGGVIGICAPVLALILGLGLQLLTGH